VNPPTTPNDPSRRSFLLSSGGFITTAFIAANFSGISAAAHHADMAAESPVPVGFSFLDEAEAKAVEAIAAQIIPSGRTPGAREAHAVNFIDHSFATYFSAMGATFREGLQAFQANFRSAHAGDAVFAAADSATQIAFLRTLDSTPFFESMRMLTILGMFSSPKYGGNFHGTGWKLLGFADQHAFAPPFGDYDRDYPGFTALT
jgi:hypothetical protein